VELCRMLRSGEAARRLRVSQESIRQWVRLGKLDCVETPLGRLFDPTEVERLARQRMLDKAHRSQDETRIRGRANG